MAALLRDYLDDGFSTVVAFALAPTVKLYEKSIKPSGLTGGGPIDTTTMYNIRYRTTSPKSLMNVENVEFDAAYDPEVFNTIKTTLMQQNNLITVTFPNGALWEFWGYLDEFVPNQHVEGEMPLASCKIIASNVNAANGSGVVNGGDEIAPAFEQGT